MRGSDRAAAPDLKAHAPRTILFALLFALVVAYTVAGYALIDVQRYAIEGRGRGTMQTERGGPATVLMLYPDGPAPGVLRVGDEVAAINGEDTSRSDLRMGQAFARARPGDAYRLTVRREGRRLDFTLPAEVVPPSKKLWSPVSLLTIFGGLAFLLVGLAVFALRPDDKQAVVLTVCLTVFGGAWEEVLRRRLARERTRRPASAEEMGRGPLPALRACPPDVLGAGEPLDDADTFILPGGAQQQPR